MRKECYPLLSMPAEVLQRRWSTRSPQKVLLKVQNETTDRLMLQRDRLVRYSAEPWRANQRAAVVLKTKAELIANRISMLCSLIVNRTTPRHFTTSSQNKSSRIQA